MNKLIHKTYIFITIFSSISILSNNYKISIEDESKSVLKDIEFFNHKDNDNYLKVENKRQDLVKTNDIRRANDRISTLGIINPPVDPNNPNPPQYVDGDIEPNNNNFLGPLEFEIGD